MCSSISSLSLAFCSGKFFRVIFVGNCGVVPFKALFFVRGLRFVGVPAVGVSAGVRLSGEVPVETDLLVDFARV
jgi:hypothetical protein